MTISRGNRIEFRHLWRAVLILLASVLAVPAPVPESWRLAQPGYSWSFPRDHWAHREFRTEWWYFTGHLQTRGEHPRNLAYQFTFFRTGLVATKLGLDSDWDSGQFIMGHAALALPAEKRHEFSELIFRETPFFGHFSDYPDDPIAWSLGPVGTDRKWSLKWNGRAFDFEMSDRRRNFGLELSTSPLKPLVFQGPGGFSPKTPDRRSGSLYYSFTRLRTEGRVILDGKSYPVTGSSWMDKECSSAMLSEQQVGWDWFGLQLDDQRELMLYRLRDSSGRSDFSQATLVRADGSVQYLTSNQFSAEPLQWWQSEATGIQYPVGWRLSIGVPELKLEIRPSLLDQENRSELLPRLNYWEGSVEVLSEEGVPLGQGFLELTGYGEDTRPPL